MSLILTRKAGEAVQVGTHLVTVERVTRAKAVAVMLWRDTSTPFKVVFHFGDSSTLTFKKVYELEKLPK